MTFSIVARSADGAWWGSAVSSRCLAVGRAVPAAAAGVGAIATQAECNLTYRQTGLELLRSGSSAEEAIEALTSDDSRRDTRQVGIVDAHGNSAIHTGSNCTGWAGHVSGDGYAIQGNFLSSADVVAAMERAWLATDPEQPLETRILAALLAGDRAGGDRRGRQSAAILVVTEDGAYEGGSDEYTNLRVDDHHDPVIELMRLYELREVHLTRTDGQDALRLEDNILDEVAVLLDRVGYRPESMDRDATAEALHRWATDHYLNERVHGATLDEAALDSLRRSAGVSSTLSVGM